MERETFQILKNHVINLINEKPMELVELAKILGYKKKSMYYLMQQIRKEYEIEIIRIKNGKKGYRQFYSLQKNETLEFPATEKYQDLKGTISKYDLLTWFTSKTGYDQTISSNQLVKMAKKYGDNVKVFDYTGDSVRWL